MANEYIDVVNSASLAELSGIPCEPEQVALGSAAIILTIMTHFQHDLGCTNETSLASPDHVIRGY
jgi:hypothetical protein